MRTFPVYLFDVDGALLDSAPDISGAIFDVLAGTPSNGLAQADLTKYIGVRLLEMFRELLPDYTPAQHEALVQEYRRIYPARGHRLTRVYPGVREALAALGARPQDCLLVGDAPADMEAGRRAEDLARFDPDYWVWDLRDLL